MSDSTQLEMIVRESGMEVESPKAKMLLEQFSDYFEIAADWESKAKMLIVTDASQITEMKMAREGRLFLREKRIAIEKKRKELKEQALREGKAIDGMANILKALIVPIEEHLAKQEKFVEIKQAEKADRLRVEAEKKAEEERIVKEKAEAEERVRIRLENESLKKEAEAREYMRRTEREAAEKHLREVEAAKREAEAARQKELDDIEAEREAERKAAAIEKTRAEKKQAELEAKLKTQITCPHCGGKLYPDGTIPVTDSRMA